MVLEQKLDCVVHDAIVVDLKNSFDNATSIVFAFANYFGERILEESVDGSY
jgi:hypothetical protein